MEKILITGATGFLGSYLCKRFLSEGFQIGIIKRTSSKMSRLQDIKEYLTLFDVDRSTPTSIVNTFKPNHIIHTACDYGRKESSLSQLVETNILFSIQLLEAAIDNQTSTFVNTDSLLPDDINDYSLSKAQFRSWLQNKSHLIDVINLRIEHMYGPQDDENKFIFWLIDQLKNEEVQEIPLTSGVQFRDFIYIDDVVDAFVQTLSSKQKGYTSFDVGTGDFLTVRTFVETLTQQLERLQGKKLNDRLRFGAREYRANEVMKPLLDNKPLLELGWAPKTNHKEGIAEILSTFE